MNNFKDVTRAELDKFVVTSRRDLICKISKEYNGECFFWEDTRNGELAARYFVDRSSGVSVETGWRIYP